MLMIRFLPLETRNPETDTFRPPSRQAAAAACIAGGRSVSACARFSRVEGPRSHTTRATPAAAAASTVRDLTATTPFLTLRTIPITQRDRYETWHFGDTAPMTDTPALAALEGADLYFEVVRNPRPTSVEESAALQGIEVERLIKTIVVRRAENDYVFVLVPGPRAIDWPKLRAHLGVSRIALPDQDEARQATGYERGTITPFGSTHAWPVVADTSLVGIGKVAIGGGGHGVNLHLDGEELIAHLGADVADVTKPMEPRK